MKKLMIATAAAGLSASLFAGLYGDTPDEARRNVRRSDKARASYYRHISGKRWGEAENYELTVDSSVGVEKAAEAILGFVSARTKTTP